MVGAVALSLSGVPAQVEAQTPLKSVEYAQPAAGETLNADFVLPQADHVSSLDVVANGKPLEKEKVKFTPADKLPNYHCAVLLVVDKTLGSGKDPNEKAKLVKAVRRTLTEIASVSGTTPYQFAVGTISAGSLDVLAPMGSEKSIVNSAIDKLAFNGTSPELYLGSKRAIDWLAGTPAERKFMILVSDGTSQDKVASQQEVVKKATEAKVIICTIGFAKSAAAAEDVQRLGPLAEETGGYALRADGSDPKLPAGAEENLDKFMVSGGKAEIDLKGLKAPVNLECTVRTEFSKAYTFSHSIDAITSAAPEAAPVPVSKSEAFLARLKTHPILTAAGLLALLLALLFIVALIIRISKSSSETASDMTTPVFQGTTPLTSPEEDTVRVSEPANPVLPALAWLVMLDADGTRHAITKGAVRIGRKPDNDIVMKNDSVSSYHAEILKRGEKFVIADLHSANKLLVSGKMVDSSPLEDGDVIELGEVRLRFVLNRVNDAITIDNTNTL
jgi:hypothetical protein